MMGQEDIVQFLKKNRNKWFCVRDISKNTGSSCKSVNCCLGKLRRYSEVFRKTVKVKHSFGVRNIPLYSFKEDADSNPKQD